MEPIRIRGTALELKKCTRHVKIAREIKGRISATM